MIPASHHADARRVAGASSRLAAAHANASAGLIARPPGIRSVRAARSVRPRMTTPPRIRSAAARASGVA